MVVRTPAREAGALLAIGGGLHFLTIPVSLVVLKAIVDARLGTIDWGDLWDALPATMQVLLLMGIFMQIVFGAAGAIAASLAFEGRGTIGGTAVLTGIGGIVFSVVLFGGIVGAVGGVLQVVGGAVAMSSRAPRFDTFK